MLDIDFFMHLALDEARKSGSDIPVGCVIVNEKGKILAKAHNEKEISRDVTAHAEILAIQKASKSAKNWRLAGCSLFVTLEPCPMCAWAILNARISNVYFGAYDNLYGALGSKEDLRKLLKSDLKIIGGIQEDACEKILKEYFKKLR